MSSEIRIRPASVFLALLVLIVALVLLHPANKGCGRVPLCAPLMPTLARIGHLVDLSTEASIPTWFAILQLAAVSVALAAAAVLKRSAGAPAAHWWGLALLFCYLSLDEATDLHGLLVDLNPGLHLKEERSGFDLVVLAAGVVAIVAAIFLPWVLKLPARTRNLFLLAGGTYVMGGMGLEAVGALVSGDEDYSSVTYTLVATAEEALEQLGVLIMLFAVLKEIGPGEITLRVSG